RLSERFSTNLSTGGSGQAEGRRRKLGRNGAAGSGPDHQTSRVFRISSSGSALRAKNLRSTVEGEAQIAIKKASARGTFPATWPCSIMAKRADSVVGID